MVKNSTMMAFTGFLAIGFIAALFAIASMFTAPAQLGLGTTVDVDGNVVALAPLDCNPDATQGPELLFALQNSENTSAIDYQAVTTHIYEGTFTKDSLPTDAAYLGDFTTLATGRPAIAAGFDVTCGKAYTILVPASSASTTSGLFHMTATQNANRATFEISEMTGLIARVYDDEAKGFVYSGTELTAGGWAGDAAIFYSTTGNITGDSNGLDVSADGYFRYTISLETNGSVSTVARFNDQETVIAIDRQNAADWNTASEVTFAGVDLIATKMASVPTRIAGDLYDDVYLVPGNPVIKTAVKDLVIRMQSLSGVNPDDDVGVGIYTAGYTRGNADARGVYGYSQNNPTNTVVHTAFDLDLTFA